jgi:hypothetical protein
MLSPIDSIRDKLIDALKVSDERRREERADRIVWMSTYRSRPGVIMGRPETLALLDEAEDAFREGHFISVQLLALAFVEHTIVEELVERSLCKERINFERAIELAQRNEVLETELISRIDGLREVRNPFAHRRRHDDPNTYGNRYISRQIHPRVMLEQDAREAFQVMYLVFSALLKVV